MTGQSQLMTPGEAAHRESFNGPLGGTMPANCWNNFSEESRLGWESIAAEVIRHHNSGNRNLGQVVHQRTKFAPGEWKLLSPAQREHFERVAQAAISVLKPVAIEPAFTSKETLQLMIDAGFASGRIELVRAALRRDWDARVLDAAAHVRASSAPQPSGEHWIAVKEYAGTWTACWYGNDDVILGYSKQSADDSRAQAALAVWPDFDESDRQDLGERP